MSNYRRSKAIKLSQVVKVDENGLIPFPLPKERFYVQVPEIATLSSMEIAMMDKNNYTGYNNYNGYASPAGYTPANYSFGSNITYTNNFRQQDQQQYMEIDHNRLIVVYWNLSQMLDAYQNGYKIKFINHKTSYELYLLIEQYFDKIDEIRHLGDEALYAFDPRLSLLDEFNKCVFGNNTSFIKNKRAAIVRDARKEICRRLGITPIPTVNTGVIRYTPVKNTEEVEPSVMTPTAFRKRKKRSIVVNATPDPNGRSAFEPQFYSTPVVDFSKIKHQTRYVDPEERRLNREHLDAKKQLEGR